MFRRTLPPVAFTAVALIATAFALNRPDERVAFAIDRASVAKVPGSDPPRYDYLAEGTVDDGGAVYRQVIGVQMIFVQTTWDGRVGTMQLIPKPSQHGLRGGRRWFRFEGFILLPEGNAFPTPTVEAYDWARRTYEHALPDPR